MSHIALSYFGTVQKVGHDLPLVCRLLIICLLDVLQAQGIINPRPQPLARPNAHSGPSQETARKRPRHNQGLTFMVQIGLSLPGFADF